MKKILSIFTVFILSFLLVPITHASFIPTIIINEIAWAGSVSSGSDEWIELYNASDDDISLLDYRIEDDGSEVIVFDDITILAGDYFLIEKREESTNVQSDLILAGLSLANTGDSIVLFDASGEIIDAVNSSGGEWFAGSSSTRGTMVRIDSDISGDQDSNWATSVNGSSATDSEGEFIIGSPKSENNIDEIPIEEISSGNKVSFEISGDLIEGEDIQAVINYEGDGGVFAYGLEIKFDPDKLQYKGGSESDFLSDEGDVETSFQIGLKENDDSVIVVSEARLDEQDAVTFLKSGYFFELEFEVLASSGQSISLEFSSSSFVSDLDGDIEVDFKDISSNIEGIPIGSLSGFSADLGSQRYSFEFQWELENSVDRYYVQRKDINGDFQDIGDTMQNLFIDNDHIIPGVTYEYRIQILSGGNRYTVQEFSIQDTRGLRGDFNRDDKVDGRDLEKLARVWKSESGDSDFDFLVDLNMDGVINSLDLFIMSGNWGKVY